MWLGAVRPTRAALGLLTAVALAGCLDSPSDGSDDPPAQLLANSDFEDGVAGWTFEGSVLLDTTEELGLPPSDGGPHAALLGREDNQTDRLVQVLRVPSDLHQLQLSGMRCYTTAEGSDQEYDTLTITIENIDSGAVDLIVHDSNLDATYEGCQWLPFELASEEDHAGQRVRLVIEGITDDAVPTSFAFDDLALTEAL